MNNEMKFISFGGSSNYSKAHCRWAINLDQGTFSGSCSHAFDKNFDRNPETH